MRKCILSMLRVGQREKTNSALADDILLNIILTIMNIVLIHN